MARTNESILSDNEKRKKVEPYDQYTGLGCYGPRIRFDIRDIPYRQRRITSIFLPEPMVRENPWLYRLHEAKSIRGFLRAQRLNRAASVEDFWVVLCELRYRYDFEFFCICQVKIMDKITATLIPFSLRIGQRILLSALEDQRVAGEPIRLNVLKGRQFGGSTLMQVYMGWIQIEHKKNWTSVICAHIKEASVKIGMMYETFVKNMFPVAGETYRIETMKRAQNTQIIQPTNCRIVVGTAIEPDSIRAEDVKMVHFSEVSSYPSTPNNNPEMLEASIISSIPNTPYTVIIRESTAKGVGNYFFHTCQKSKRGETAYRFVFIPTYLIEIYREEFNGSYYSHTGKRITGTAADFVSTLTDYERNLFENYPAVTLEYLNWRRYQASLMPSEMMMKQEYPNTDMEAFQSSNSLVFDADHIERMRENCTPPAMVGRLIGDAPAGSDDHDGMLSGLHFDPNKAAEAALTSAEPTVRDRLLRDMLCVWALPDTETRVSDRYVVVFDPQRGTSEGADNGVIVVFDRYWMMYDGVPEVVAQFCGHLDMYITAWIATQIAHWYCDALLVIESNTYTSARDRGDISEFIFDTIKRYYWNLYSHTNPQKVREGKPIKYGFPMTHTTKLTIIESYRKAIKKGEYMERDEQALDEARVFEKKSNGVYGAIDGYRDDRLITRMIGLHILYRLPIPKIIDNTATYRPRFDALPSTI